MDAKQARLKFAELADKVRSPCDPDPNSMSTHDLLAQTRIYERRAHKASHERFRSNAICQASIYLEMASLKAIIDSTARADRTDNPTSPTTSRGGGMSRVSSCDIQEPNDAITQSA